MVCSCELLQIDEKTIKLFSCHKVKSLSSLDEDIISKFSAMKLGLYKSIEDCATEICSIIRKNLTYLESKGWVLTCCPARFSSYPALYILRLVANSLGLLSIELPIISKGRDISYLSLNEMEREKFISENLHYPISGFEGKNVILIDDACSTKVYLKEVSKFLFKNGAKEVYVFVYLKLPQRPVDIELRLIKYMFEKNGINFLIDIAKDKRNPFVSKYLHCVSALPLRQVKILFNLIGTDRRLELIKSLKRYAKQIRVLKRLVVFISKYEMDNNLIKLT